MLRRIRESDLESLFAYRNDPAVAQWCRDSAPLHYEGHKAWYLAQTKNPKVSLFAIDDGPPACGVCGLTDIDLVHRRAEFNIYVGKEHQGKRLGRDALIALFRYGFYTLGLNRIYGETFEGNPALILFKRLNMTEEGLRRDFYYRDGRFINAHLISISRESFDTYLNTKKEIDTPRNPTDHPLTPI